MVSGGAGVVVGVVLVGFIVLSILGIGRNNSLRAFTTGPWEQHWNEQKNETTKMFMGCVYLGLYFVWFGLFCFVCFGFLFFTRRRWR
eukprot:m.444965 g.444965  ORF g.444965 m.444965 type:complete len:87 (+) comp20300_c18_seq2:1479-1739(+)